MSKSVKSAREEQQALEALHRLDEECVHHQRANDYLRAFDCMERALVLRRHFFGLESEEVALACRALAEMCNLLAMSFLQQDNFPVAVDLLKKAEVLTAQHGSRFAAERATTLNNLACYYRRLGKLHAAMTSLRSAVEIERRLGRVDNAADTLLNFCAVLSQLGKHDQALAHAQEALLALQEDVFKPSMGSPSLDRVSVMCIAYHNIGVEQEFLKAYGECVQSYKKGVGLAEQYLGPEHSVTTTIRNSYLAAKRSLSTKPRGTRQQQRSDDSYASSPSKAARRLLSSPRDNGGGPSSPSSLLRMPSPLTKEKQRQNIGQIPTPRSIVADALSRKSLPPLESPNGRDSSKKSGDNAPVVTPLTPTDPFFSPRYRFPDSEARVEPESTVTASPERNKRASSALRRRSSVKKTVNVGRGNRVSFVTTEQDDEHEETKAKVESEKEVAPAEGQDSMGAQVVALTPAEEALEEVASKSAEVDVEVTQDFTTVEEEGVETVANAQQPEMTSVSSQIVETEEEKVTFLAVEREDPASPAGVLPDEAKADLANEVYQPTELESVSVSDLVEGDADQAEDGAFHQPDTLGEHDQGEVDDPAEVEEVGTDDIANPDAVIETTAPTNEEVQDEGAEIYSPNDKDHGDVAGMEAVGEAATEDGTFAAVDYDLGVQGNESDALTLESTEDESSPVIGDLCTSDQNGEAVEEVPAPVELTGHGDEGESYETISDDQSDSHMEQQAPDEWPSPQDDISTTEVADEEAHAEYPADATGYDGAVDESHLHADAVVESGEAYHYEHTEVQPTAEAKAAQDHYEDYGGEEADRSLQYEQPHPTEERQLHEDDQQAQDPASYEDALTLEATSYEAVGHEETNECGMETTDDAHTTAAPDPADLGQEHQDDYPEGDGGGEVPPPSTE